ncbi:glycosyltransferase family A protein [Sunxiuqinia indica]|uniref:glycosyltransferase family A protein n=1 Tax=Sunxiuqinia indica TaxID=2692584 RepID=UPI00135B6D93|nr:glycosyltransferase family A protein [Sunxiuqinia indica]
MPKTLVITPVKDSIETTLQTIEAIHAADGDHLHYVYNDFSTPETKKILEKKKKKFGFELINLEEITNTPSPNYNLVLQMAQKKAIDLKVPLVIVESDVIIKRDTLDNMYDLSLSTQNCGMLGAITTDESGQVNFPYLNFKGEKKEITDTSHSLSFCCTLLSLKLLESFSFKELSSEKHWYDVFISRKSKLLGFKNYLVTNLPVVHKPHSSRPWKQLKYTNPLKYYFNKLIKRKDRI